MILRHSSDTRGRKRAPPPSRNVAAPALPGSPSAASRALQGRVVCGNLMVLVEPVRHAVALRRHGAIVALEDIREAPYRI